MKLFERVKKVSKELASSETKLASLLGLPQRTFNGYLNEKSQRNLWELLPAILECFPQLNRDWLYFGEGEMLKTATERDRDTAQARRVTTELPYPDDALGRIAMLTNVGTSSALELQSVFGADFKEIKKFLSRYMQARQARETWIASGAKEEETPEPPEPLPDEWLRYFWTHFGPNPGWIQYGEREFSRAPVLREWPREAQLERLQGELSAARRECDLLRERLAKGEYAGTAALDWEKGLDKTVLLPTSVHGGPPEKN